MINIAVDAMGGDNAPYEIVKGAIEYIKDKEVKITFVGKEDAIQAQLLQLEYDVNKVEIVNADEIIENEDSPVKAIRKKKNSSLVVALKLVKEGKVDGLITAGNTGAVVAGSTVIVGRIKGVLRPAVAPILPTLNGHTLLIDCGANVDAKPEYLKQFAEMGEIYVREILNIENPRIGLVNIGVEPKKGNELVKKTYSLLEKSDLNFVGNIEARDVLKGNVDVLVCDAFVGNVILKEAEGIIKDIFSLVKREIKSGFITSIGGMLAKNAFKNIKKKFDHSEYGGVALLGLNGLVVKAHGSSKSKDIQSALREAIKYIDNDISKKIKDKINNKESQDIEPKDDVDEES